MLYRSRKGSSFFLPPLFFITDRARCSDPLSVIAALPVGSGVVLRDYQVRQRKTLAHAIAELAKTNHLVFLVGADPTLAREVGANGLHLPEWTLMSSAPRPKLRENWLVTASVHNIRALRRAENLGVNAVFLSTAFPTKSHPGQAGLGIHRLQRLAGQTSLPIYPLGGVSEQTITKLPKMSNMAGIAGISFFME